MRLRRAAPLGPGAALLLGAYRYEVILVAASRCGRVRSRFACDFVPRSSAAGACEDLALALL